MNPRPPEQDDSTGTALTDALLAYRPRESSGASSANRFGYQRTWALCHLLDLHERPGDYVLILEYHDDIVVLDDAVAPTVVDFYQVKTRAAGQWSRADLVRVRASTERAPKRAKKSRKRGPSNEPTELSTQESADVQVPRSIVGKLIEHSKSFSSHIRSLNIVSNACFKIPLAAAPTSNERERFSFEAATPGELAEFEKALEAELALRSPFPWPKVHCHCTPISLLDHETHAVGVLAGFLDRRHPNGRFAVQPLFRVLAGEFARRATNEWQPTSFVELCAKKGVRRSDLEGFLQHAIERPDPSEQLTSTLAMLTAEGVLYRELNAIREGWNTYNIGLTDMTDVLIQEFRVRIVGIVAEVAEGSSWNTLREFMRTGHDLYSSRHGPLMAPITYSLMQGALLRELKNHEARKSTAPDSQPSEKAP